MTTWKVPKPKKLKTGAHHAAGNGPKHVSGTHVPHVAKVKPHKASKPTSTPHSKHVAGKHHGGATSRKKR